MKRKLIIPVLLVFSVFCITSCDEILDKLNITFEMGPHVVDFEIEPMDKGATFASYDVVFHDIEEEIEENGGSMDQLDEVTPKNATITILSGATNFDAFEMVEVYISTETMSPKKIGWINTIPRGMSSLTPELSPDNLKAYLQESAFTLTLKGILRDDVTTSVMLQGSIYFDVNL